MDSNIIYNLSKLPDHVLTLRGDHFYSFVKSMVGLPLHDILKIQLIDSSQSFLDTIDVFEIFKYDSPDLLALKAKSCFKINDEYVVKVGIKNSLTYLTALLKAEKNKSIAGNYNNDSAHRQISYELLNDNPSLKSLIDWYEGKQDTIRNNNSNRKQSFLSSFIDNIANNLTRPANNYQYNDSIKRFALLLYILGGRLTYELVRINLVGALPHLTTIQKLILNSNLNLKEGEYQFDNLKLHLKSSDVQFGFASEDCSSVIRKIKYDVNTNSFVGFSTPLTHGIPMSRYYQTDSFEKLKTWFSTINKAPQLNVHMFQPLPTAQGGTPSPFLLSAYGVENTFTANDVLRRWLFIFENCMKRQIRIIGFSTDGDSKYMSAMRLMSGLFGSLPNFKLHKHPDVFKISLVSKWPWYYLRPEQLFLFLQDPTHVVTKWRNRLLSATAELRIGQQTITMDHLRDIVDNEQYTKLDHNLNLTDLNPKDRQNYHSCEKISSDSVLNILKNHGNKEGTFVYIYLLRLIITTYIQRTTPLRTRLKSAWIIVFVCRLWLSWLRKENFRDRSSKPRDKQKYFITRTAYLSIELNAHSLLYVILLVQQKLLPKECLHIYLFNSQPCESMFRNARSLSGAYSTVVNFTTYDFLRRATKLSILNEIKYNELANQTVARISFPVHHKHKRDDDLSIIQNLDDVDNIDIEEVILESYNASIKLTENLGITTLLKKHKIYTLEKLSKFIFNDLNSKSKVFDNTTRIVNDDNDHDSSSSEYDDCRYENSDDESNNTNKDTSSNDDDDMNPSSDDDVNDEDLGSDDNNDDLESDNSDDDRGSEDDNEDDGSLDAGSDDENAERIESMTTGFSGIRMKDTIKPELTNSYFQVKVNGAPKYLHKQSAVWLLTDRSDRLSSDRLSRVWGRS